MSRQRPGVDSSEQPLARMQTAEREVESGSDMLLLVTTWTPPFASIDSLVVDRRTLAPVSERLALGNDRYVYDYSTTRVSGTVTKDSAARRVDQSLAAPVFAFNEVDVLVRAVQARPGRVFIVPLFSEVDAAVEWDTLSVLDGTEPAESQAISSIRFADAVITSLYTLDARSHRIINVTTRNRRTGTVFRMRPSE